MYHCQMEDPWRLTHNKNTESLGWFWIPQDHDSSLVCSAVKIQSIPNILPIKFQTISEKATSNKAIILTGIVFHVFNSNISVATQVAYTYTYTFDEACQCNVIFGANFLDKFGFTLNYNEKVLQWVDHKIPPKDWVLCGKEMLTELNNNHCQTKSINMIDQEKPKQLLCCTNSWYQIWTSWHQQVAVNQKQLNPNQCRVLQNVMAKYDNSLMGLLVSTLSKRLTSICSQA